MSNDNETEVVRCTLRVPRGLYEQFQAYAKSEQRSVNGQMLVLMRAAVNVARARLVPMPDDQRSTEGQRTVFVPTLKGPDTNGPRRVEVKDRRPKRTPPTV